MTIKDLARLSGYSLGTVSRVLNNQPNVSQKARDAIMAIVDEKGFELNTNAKNLKQQKSASILVIVKGRANELFSQLVEQIQSLVAGTEHPLLLDYIDEDENEVRRALQLCREKKPEGILFLGGISRNFREEFGAIPLPAVLVTNAAESLGFPNLSSVTTDDAAAACCAVQYLMDQGHREIVILGGDCEKSEISHLRYEGCVRAFRERGNSELCIYENTRFSFRDGYESMGRVLDTCAARVTAVFAMADVIAIGAIRCICDHGLRVPEDISIIGFDGLPVGQYYMPKLATIGQQTDEMARECIRILLDAIGGAPSQHQTVPFTRMPGESIRKLHA
ncbi:MAG: LacI family DNA-binding transcriptional regulator [Oscillospiraceae bacterium]|nr:LacI family DNA-binding transcriptional regulator [Oscillospiraceae bacterium]